MTEEIKEIIEHIKTYPEKMYCLSEKEKIRILDYITNLQQAIEIKNQRIKEEQQEKERYMKFYNGLNKWNKELQQENERLKEELNYTISQVQHNQIVTKLCKEKEDYKSRCNKAIELYKKCKEEDYCILSIKMYEILKGSDDE